MATDPANYDEFGLFHENAADAGLDWHGPPTVERVETVLDDGRVISALRWGTDPVEVVLVHGGGQNAHTWDTTLLALGRPALAVDLPGHGHSGDVDEGRPIGPRSFAADIAHAVADHAPDASLLVGMSLGGLTAIHLAATRPDLIRSLVVIDVTPGVTKEKAHDVVAFLAGPESFESFDQILERTMQFNPTRSESSLRRGILHNARQREDGTWVWRHQRGAGQSTEARLDEDRAGLWDDLAGLDIPVRLLVGDRSPVVDDDDQARFAQACPDAPIVTVADAGHSIQGDQPVVLASLLAEALG